MSIKTVGQTQNLIQQYQAQDWAKSVELGQYLENPGRVGGSETPLAPKDKSFADFLAENIAKVNELQGEANVAIQKLTTGESKNIHETLILVEQAEIAFKTMNQIRQKVLDAYREVMKMQV